MQHKTNIEIKARFFEAFDKLVELGSIGNRSAFFDTYEIDKRNLLNSRTNEGRKVDTRMLSILVADFGISAEWLLTGRGKMFANLIDVK